MANTEVLDYLVSARQACKEAIEEELARVEMIRLQREAFLETEESRSLIRRMQQRVAMPMKLDQVLIDICTREANKLDGIIQRMEEGNRGLVEDYFEHSIKRGVQAIAYATIDPTTGLSMKLLAKKARLEMDLLNQLNPEKVKTMTWERGMLNWD